MKKRDSTCIARTLCASGGDVVALSVCGVPERDGVTTTSSIATAAMVKVPLATAMAILLLARRVGSESTSARVGPSSEGWRHVRSCGGIGPCSTRIELYPRSCTHGSRLRWVGTRGGYDADGAAADR